MGQVSKLTIQAFKTIDCKGTAVGKIEMQVNPEKIAFEYSIEFGADSGGSSDGNSIAPTGAAGESMKVLGAPSYDFPGLQVETIIDATGVLPVVNDSKNKSLLEKDGIPSVMPYIEELKKVCYNYVDEIHGPPFLMVTWGKIMPSSGNKQGELDGVFRGRLTKLGITYVLFGADGNPVRAEISMTIDAAVNPETRPTGNSPDLTHLIEVKFGDNLPALCKDVYGSPEFFLQIAKINNLPSIYAIEPGMKLLFPPLDKASR